MKRKNIFKSLLAAAMALTMIFGAAPLSGFVGISLPLFSMKAEAAIEIKTTEDGLFEYALVEQWTGSEYGYAVTIIRYKGPDSGEVVIPEKIEGYEVKSLIDDTWDEKRGFRDCTGITSIVIPDSVTYIGARTFYGCTSLKEIDIPDSVTNIGARAFYGCTSLSKVKLSNNLTIIDEGTFLGCTSLAEIVIPDSVTEIRGRIDSENYYGGAFFGCTSLSKVKLSNNLTKIGVYTFSGCTSLKEITIPDSVTGIDFDAFSGCTSLSKVKLSNNLTIINGFSGCTSLKEITIPDSVTEIGSGAFSGCTSFQEIEIPDSVTEIGSGAFSGCTSLQEIEIPDSVTEIGSYAFSGCTSLKEITIPDSVTKMGNDYYELGCVFSGCTSLSKVKLSNNLTKIENRNFSGCTSLEEITIPDSVTEIGPYAFSGCTILQKIEIPDSVMNIDVFAFSGCTTLSKVDLPKKLTTIEAGIFRDCTSLKEIVIPDSVTEIRGFWYYDSCDGAFSGCITLSKVKLSNNLTKIENRTFSGCTSLREITIPDSVTSIGDSVFSGCTSLESVTIGSGVEQLDIDAFFEDSNAPASCRRLANITVSPDNKTYSSVDGVLFNKDKSELLAYPIGNKRSSYTIPDGVTKIGERAFYGCRYIETLTIPASVKEIEDSALGNCYDIRTINYLGTREQWKEVIIGADNYMFALVNVGCADDTRCDHVWGEWVVVDAATTEKEGLEKRVCSLCSAEETRKIPKLDIVKVTAIELSDSERTATVGTSFTITATVKPDDALNRTIIWSSSDPSIATVDENGTVTAIAEGEAIITAESADGVKAECKVTVEKAKESFGKKLLNVVTAPFRAIINLFKKLFGKSI